MGYIEKYNEWKEKVTDKVLKEELEKMEGNTEAIENAFYKDLEFGTGGMRGVLGVGTNCLNIYNIRKVTEGVSRYMVDKGLESAAISYDSRINSKLFAHTAAAVFASHGIKVYIVADVSPTPFLSFAVRKLNCGMGVMVTASHNPKKYNGYKLYNSTGCQILDDEAYEVVSYVEKVDPFEVKPKDDKVYIKQDLINVMESWVYGSFLNSVEAQSLNDVEKLKIVYTPLNGAGYKLVPSVLYERGFDDITIVPEQAKPNGNFTTCPYPNPEKPEALKLALKIAKEIDADIVLATDPDCDRVGAAVKHRGDFVLITGNEMGVLLADYILGTKHVRWNLPQNGIIVTTIVSTPMAEKIADRFNIETRKVLTGFKWIGDQMNKLDADGELDRFILGFEESYGYLAGGHARDKDAVVASMLICEMTSVYLKQGKTLVDQLAELHKIYGKYENKNISKAFEGVTGAAKMQEILANLRKKPLKKLAGGTIVKFIDYMNQNEQPIPKSNVLSYETDNGLSIIIRPSGTEPLCKFYMTASAGEKENKTLFAAAEADLDKIFG
ncbi:MAG: phospho-sugar mutase [Clostridia bacterium]|nr:phospho-sugar mutase [Clostridia bacterium]